MEDGSSQTRATSTFFVGIAASAGGLEAASSFVQNLPKTANAIYVLAQHMSPTHKSLLTALLSRETKLPVEELDGEVVPVPDTIYVTPPNSDVVLEDGRLKLKDPRGHPATPKPSADRLFASLAAECGDLCVGIVLSGTGSDGSYGIQAVREAGGITIAQDSATAKYEGMPSAAIETGCIDLTLTPEQIGQHLERILSSPRNFEGLRQINQSFSRLSDLLHILMVRTQVNFREYKENTIQRRINRRMVALGIDSYEEYVEVCRTSLTEVDALHRDLLISVTRFFRDPTQFEQLEHVIQDIVQQRENQQIRVWVAGCATGEEAYSIAVLVAEALGGIEKLKKNNVQIFASDIDERALDMGRRGVYPASAAADIPKRFLGTYFENVGENIQVVPALRSVVLFSKHNVAQDPPFINVDLVSLRNILIYFNAALQERVLRRVHYAMNPQAHLYLGTSESVGSMQQHFELRSGTDKIFSKRATSSMRSVYLPEASARLANSGNGTPGSETRKAQGGSVDFEMFDALARSVAPNGFIVTKTDQIVRILGDISSVVELSENSTLNMSTRILRPGLRDEASSLISVTLKTMESRTGRWHAVPTSKQTQARLKAFPIKNTYGGEDHVLFAIQFREEKNEPQELDKLSETDRVKYMHHIEQEMLATRDSLQQTVEELQTSNEELQSVNEEMQSTNEELQATNEELETSNEELQSTNEELITVNEEMQVNAAELQRVTVELSSVVKFAPYAILVVDNALLVRRISDRAKEQFDLTDLPVTGLHLAQISFPESFPQMASICSEALRERKPKLIQVEAEGRTYSLTVAPFSGAQDTILGLQVTVVEMELSSFFAMADLMNQLGNVGYWRLNADAQKVHWSSEVFRIHGLDASSEAVNTDDAIEYYHPDDRSMVQGCIQNGLTAGEPFKMDARIVQKDGTVVPIQTAGTPIKNTENRVSYLVGSVVDRTEQLKNTLLLKQFEDVQEKLNLGAYSYDVESQTALWSRNLHLMLGMDPDKESASVNLAIEMFHPDDRDRISGYISAAIEKGEPYDFEARLQRKDGSEFPCRGYGNVLRDGAGKVSHVYGYFLLQSDPEGQRSDR